MDEYDDTVYEQDRGEDEHDMLDGSETPDRPPPILIPQSSGGRLRRCQSTGHNDSIGGSSCSSASSPSTSALTTTLSRCPSSMGELRNDREIITMVCSSAKNPEDVDTLDLSTVAKKTRKSLKSLRALADFVNLVQLNVANNAVGSLDGVDVFVQLEVLSMSRNHLKRVGSPLFTLTSLRHLDLSGNFISHIPKAIVGLEQLETLNLSGNNLSILKEVDPLGKLANLHECSFIANPFCKLPTYKDYVIYKLPSLEKLDESVITVLVRDKSRRRFSEEMFSKDSKLREVGIAHENEQNKLREARSALEAENLRLKGELQVKSKLLQNKSKEWSSATGQLLQLQQEIAMLNLERRGSTASSIGGSGSPGFASSSFSIPSPHSQRLNQSDPRLSMTSGGTSSSSRLSESFAQATSGSRTAYEELLHDHTVVDEEDLDFHLHQSIRSVSPINRSGSTAATAVPAVSPQHQNLRYSAPRRNSLRIFDQFDEEVASLSAQSPDGRAHHHLKEDHSSYSKRLIDSACSPLRNSSYPPEKLVMYTTSSNEEQGQEISQPNPIAVSPQPGRSNSFDHVRRAFSELSPQSEHREATATDVPTDREVDLAEDDAIKNDMSINRSIRFPTFEDDLACPAYEDEVQAQHLNRQHQQQQRQSPVRYEQERTPSYYSNHQYSQHHRVAALSPQRLLSSPSPSPSPRSKAQRMWKRQHDEFREQTFGSPSKSPLKLSSMARDSSSPHRQQQSASSPIDKDMLTRQIQALQSCKQSLVTEIAKEEQLLHVLKQEVSSYANQMDQLHLGIQVCLSQDNAAAEAAGAVNMGGVASPRSVSTSKKQRDEENYRVKLEFCRSKLRFAEDKEKEIEMTMVRTTKRVLQSDLQNTPFDKEIFALTHKLQQVIVQKEEIHQEMSRLMALMRDQQQRLSANGGNDESGNGGGGRRRSSTGNGNGGNYQQQTVDDMLEEEEQRQRLSAEHQQTVALARKRLDELQRRYNDVQDRIHVKEERIASFVEELKDVKKELSLISQCIPPANSPHPHRRQRSVSLDFYPSSSSSSMPSPSQTTMDVVELELAEALKHIKSVREEAETQAANTGSGMKDLIMGQTGDDSHGNAIQGPSCSDASSSTTGNGDAGARPCSESPNGKERPSASYELKFKELLTAEMLEEIKKDIYERLSTQLVANAKAAGESNGRSVAQDHKDLHKAIAAALETQMKLAIESFHKKRDDDERKRRQKKDSAAASPSPSRRMRAGKDPAIQSSSSLSSGVTTRSVRQDQLPPGHDTAKDDDIACDQLDDFVPVDANYAKKYRFVKYRSSLLSPPSPTGGGGGTSKSSSRATGAQRILKACERLDQAENECKIDPVSAIEVDPMGNKRSSLKVLLMGARDLPTTHLRTKNLDPYVSLKIVYPEYIVSGSLSKLSYGKCQPISPSGGGGTLRQGYSADEALFHNQASNQSFRSRTKKKTVYPVWDEDFEFGPVLSLKGYLHVRILNDRKLSREQLVGEVRIPLRTLLHQKKAVDWFSLRIAVPPSHSSSSTSDLIAETTRKSATILRASGGTIRLQLQLTYSRLEKYKRAVDELVTKYFHEHNQLPPFIESAAGHHVTIERRKQQHAAHNQEQHNDNDNDDDEDDQEDHQEEDAMPKRRYAPREDAEALEEFQYHHRLHQQHTSGGGVPEVESPVKDSESAIPTFDAWKAERGAEAIAIAAHQQRLHQQHQYQQRPREAQEHSSYGDISPQRSSADVMISSHIFDSGPAPPGDVHASQSSSSASVAARLSAEHNKRLWETPVSQEPPHTRNAGASNVHTSHSSTNRASFYPESGPLGLQQQERMGRVNSSTFHGNSSSGSTMLRHPSFLTPVAANTRYSMPGAAMAMKVAPFRAASYLLGHTSRGDNRGGASRHSQSYGANPLGRRKTTGMSQRPECFDDYSPYHPDFKFTDVLDLGNNDHFVKKRKSSNLYVWQSASHGGIEGFGGNGGISIGADDVNRKTDLRIFKSPGFSRRQPTSGFPERYIGLDNQTCERLKRMFGRMDGASG